MEETTTRVDKSYKKFLEFPERDLVSASYVTLSDEIYCIIHVYRLNYECVRQMICHYVL